MLEAALRMARVESPFVLRQGVQTGRVFAGFLGADYRRTYTLMGDPVNTAARMLGQAEDRQIVAVDTVVRVSRTVFETEALDPFLVKGKTEPITAYKVLSASESVRHDSSETRLVGGGTPPILTPRGWLALYHGVEVRGVVGVYRTFWALLDRDEPSRVLRLEDTEPLLEARPELSRDLDALRYVHDIVFTTGIVEDGDEYLIASGEDDLACRLTRVPKTLFA
jgi:hypothetical protein